MCALCGLLGPDTHWSDPAFLEDPARRRATRRARIAAANRLLAPFALRLDDWQGASYLLATRTGKTEIIDGLTGLWAAAERLIGRACDPLDPAFLARLATTQA